MTRVSHNTSFLKWLNQQLLCIKMTFMHNPVLSKKIITYIMVKCLSVTKILNPRIQGIWSFLMFIDTFRIQDILSFLLFIDSFRTQRNWSFPCFLTHSVLKGIGRNHVSWHFCIQRIWSFLMFIDTFRIQKSLETVKRQNPLKYSKNLANSPVSRHCLLGKVGRLEGLKVGRLEVWIVGRLEDRKVQVRPARA